jgi:hypothetical protein
VDDGPNPDSTTDSTFYSPPSDPSNEESNPVIANFEGFTASTAGCGVAELWCIMQA